MANCLTITNGLCRQCLDSVGGVKKAYLISMEDFNDAIASFSLDATDGFITDYTYNTGFTACKWYPLVPQKNTSNYVETINISAENGTLFYNGVLSMNFGKMTMAKLNTINEMAKGDMGVLFVDGNNKMWFLGGLNVTVTGGVPTAITIDPTNGCVLGNQSFATGTAKGDANGASLTFTCDMQHPVVEVQPKVGGGIETDLATADALC